MPLAAEVWPYRIELRHSLSNLGGTCAYAAELVLQPHSDAEQAAVLVKSEALDNLCCAFDT